MTSYTKVHTEIIATFALKKMHAMYGSPGIHTLISDTTPVDEMKFHESWDWLIPIWVKVWRNLFRDSTIHCRTIGQEQQALKINEEFSNLVNNDNIVDAFFFVSKTIQTNNL